ncbi:MAG: hypothetical protein GAK45_01676 [Pseudomonas citronellolis]|nr:MAG: hypothetical protein GAK45_01676 [Pseudomonas citronellolis]
MQAFAEAGADVLYAPGLNTREAVQRVVSELAPKPVNILLSGPIPGLSLEWLAEVGVKRVSVGSALSRVALGAFYQAAQALRGGDVTELGQAMPFDVLNGYFV